MTMSITDRTAGTRDTTTLRVLPDFLGRVAGSVHGYISRARAERQLESLDDRLLADIGLRRSEIHKMVWGSNR